MNLKYALILSLAVSATALTPAHALVVSDPGSYARQAMQLQEMTKQLDEFKKQVEQAKKTADAVSGLSNRGNGALVDLTNLKKASEKMIMGLLTTNGQKVNESTIDAINRGIEDTFKVIEQDPVAARQTRQQRAIYRDKANKAALQHAEYTISNAGEAMGRLEALSAQINQTNTLKDSVDLNNRYQAEISGQLSQMIMMQSLLLRAESAGNFVNKAPKATAAQNKADFNRWTDKDEVFSQQFKQMGK